MGQGQTKFCFPFQSGRLCHGLSLPGQPEETDPIVAVIGTSKLASAKCDAALVRRARSFPPPTPAFSHFALHYSL